MYIHSRVHRTEQRSGSQAQQVFSQSGMPCNYPVIVANQLRQLTGIRLHIPQYQLYYDELSVVLRNPCCAHMSRLLIKLKYIMYVVSISPLISLNPSSFA